MSREAIKLDFNLEAQEDSRLCWAAVAISIALFYNKQQNMSQKELAKSVFGEKYNQFNSPKLSLSIFDNCASEEIRPLDESEIIHDLKAGNPVAACLRYFIGWHLVVIFGIDANGHIHVADPLQGYSLWPLDEFTTAYRTYYQWTHTYRLKKPSMVSDLSKSP